MILTIIIFFVITFGLGYSVLCLCRIKPENNFEKYFIYLAIGIGTFPILSVILNLLRIPLHWVIYAILAILVPCIIIIKARTMSRQKNKEQKLFRLTKTNIYMGLAFIFAFILFMVYLKGAFTYNYLEDDDSWDHAVGSKYISLYKTYSRAIDEDNFKRTYTEPYPPSYDVLMGVLHQTNDSVSWTLKFFNTLLIALGITFFYLFAVGFFNNKLKALVATFIITILPSFMSHFIWSQTLALVLFFPAFYALSKIKENRKWLWVSIIIISSILVAQPSTAVIFGAMLGIYWFVMILIESIQKKKITLWGNNKHFLVAGIGGLLVSMIYWVPTFIKFGTKITFLGIGLSAGLFSTKEETLLVDTSGGIVYGLRDFFIAPLVSKMDQPIGWGAFVFILIAFAIIMLVLNYKKLKTKHYVLTALLWFVFCMLGTESNALPMKLFPHRFWVFLAIPVALLAAEGIMIIYNSLKSKKQVLYPVMVVIFVGLIITSAYPKYVVETSHWPFGGGWSSYEEIQGYQWMADNFPKNTPVFNLCLDEEKVIGFDMYAPPLDLGIDAFRRGLGNRSVSVTYTAMKNIMEVKGFEFAIIDLTCTRSMGNKTNELLEMVGSSEDFELVHQVPNNFFMFKKI